MLLVYSHLALAGTEFNKLLLCFYSSGIMIGGAVGGAVGGALVLLLVVMIIIALMQVLTRAGFSGICDVNVDSSKNYYSLCLTILILFF